MLVVRLYINGYGITSSGSGGGGGGGGDDVFNNIMFCEQCAICMVQLSTHI